MERISKRRNKVWLYCLAMVIFVILIGLVGTVDTASAQQEEKKGVKEVEKQKEVKIELFEGFPKDIPIYPKSEIIGFALKFGEHFGLGSPGVWFKSSADCDKVFNWLESEFKKKGWEILQKIDMRKFGKKGGELTVTKDERTFMIGIGAEKEKDTTSWSIMGDLLSKEEIEKQKQPRKYLPKDIPLYPNLEMVAVRVESKGVSVQFESKEEPVKLARHVIQECEKMGWQIVDKMGAQGTFATFEAKKGERAINMSMRKTEYSGEGFSKVSITKIVIGYTFKKE